MIVIPLGVSSATPTAVRHMPSVALWRDGNVYLFDCGENAQMRLLQAGIKRSKVDTIFISHMDGDHVFGLFGLLSTLQLQRRNKELTIVGPQGIKEMIDAVMKATGLEIEFQIKYNELKDDMTHEVVLEDEDFYVEARPMKHTRFCIGYRLQEKDKPGKVDAEKAKEAGITEDEHFKALKAGNDVTLEDGSVVHSADIVGDPRPGESFVYITDTEFCENAVRLSENATILYHEATFGEPLKEKAEDTGHSSAQDAAIVAKTAKVDRLVIGHFSARYSNQFLLLKEARGVFEKTWLAYELRPIFTNPAQEKDIVSPRVEIIDLKEKKAQKPRKTFKPAGNRKGGFKKKRFKRKPENARYYRADSDNNQRGRYNRPYRSTDGDRSKSSPHRPSKPLPITPRTPFDDFDRF
ncbi:ribonuclease Z [Balneolaceae bacterium ANBcel3]|nr:ribonuclease Z [Balneolaceae bacterium ANBcel3]